MNVRHVVIAFDNATAAGTQSMRIDIPWPSIMTVRQIEYHHDGTGPESVMLSGDWISENGGIFAFAHDGTSVAPCTTFCIPHAVQGTHNVNVLDVDKATTNQAAYVMVMLEFRPIEKADEKKSSS